MIRIILIVMTVMLLAACSKEHMSEISATAWSDDSEQIAFLEKSFVRIKGINGIADKNIKYRLGLTDRNDDSRKYISEYFNFKKDIFKDLTPKDVYFKSDAGYFLVRSGSSGSIIKNGEIFTDNVDYNFYDLDGNIIYQISKKPDEYCEQFSTALPVIRAVPSPSGAKVAVVETTSSCELEIKILTYNGGFEVLTSETISGMAVAGMFWVGDNNLFINSCLWVGCSDNWNLFRIGEIHLIDDDLFDSLCLSGVVVSSNINSSWERIEWSKTGQSPNIILTDDFNHTELGYFNESNTRKPDDPENCISVDHI